VPTAVFSAGNHQYARSTAIDDRATHAAKTGYTPSSTPSRMSTAANATAAATQQATQYA